MKILPTRDFLLIEAAKAHNGEKMTESGLIVLEKSDDTDLQVTKGTVLAAGPLVKEYKVKQVVYYNFFSGNQIRFKENGDEVVYHLVIEADILALEK